MSSPDGLDHLSPESRAALEDYITKFTLSKVRKAVSDTMKDLKTHEPKQEIDSGDVENLASILELELHDDLDIKLTFERTPTQKLGDVFGGIKKLGDLRKIFLSQNLLDGGLVLNNILISFPGYTPFRQFRLGLKNRFCIQGIGKTADLMQYILHKDKI